MFNPKVSIIIPVYNGSNYLSEAIESALNQTYQNIEILVINDGSSDNGDTEKVAFSFGDKIKYFYKENGGVSTALNFGIEKMTGEYFSWLSHDDLYYPNKIEKQINFLQGLENKNVILSSDVEIINSKGEKESVTITNYKSEEILYELLFKGSINGCTLLIPKIIFDKVGVFNIKLKTTQDYELWIRMAKYFSFIHMPNLLIKSRQHEEQDSKGKILIAINEQKQLQNFVLKNYDSDLLKKQFNSKLPTNVFIGFLHITFLYGRILTYVKYITIKLGIYNFLYKIKTQIKKK